MTNKKTKEKLEEKTLISKFLSRGNVKGKQDGI
jgi:hypothetical protein